MKKVRVSLASNGYDIYIGSGLLEQAGRLLTENGFTGRLVVITNPVLKGLYGDMLVENLSGEGYEVVTLQVPDGEEAKSLEMAGRLYNELTRVYAERSTPILALGGGVIGDLAGFVAATYLRGVPLIQVPTTLLAQVDSSIGGKVAVNHEQLKNMIGAFYQPKLVITDVGTLKTLPDRDFTSGLAEVIKYAVIWDKELFIYLERNLNKIKILDDSALEEIVYRTSAIKAGIVEQDERDFGLRNILNYGHTVGHAMESVSDFRMQHGEAVAVGMIAAARISNRLGNFNRDELRRLEGLISGAGLPTGVGNLDVGEIIRAMKHDKKVREGKVRFVLPESIGKVFIADEVDLSLVEQVLVGWNEKT